MKFSMKLNYCWKCLCHNIFIFDISTAFQISKSLYIQTGIFKPNFCLIWLKLESKIWTYILFEFAVSKLNKLTLLLRTLHPFLMRIMKKSKADLSLMWKIFCMGIFEINFTNFLQISLFGYQLILQLKGRQSFICKWKNIRMNSIRRNVPQKKNVIQWIITTTVSTF